MNNPKDNLDDLCIQFFDDGEDERSRGYAWQLEDAGYKVHYLATSGASALLVEGYEVVGHTGIGNVVEQLVDRKQMKKAIIYTQQRDSKEDLDDMVRQLERADIDYTFGKGYISECYLPLVMINVICMKAQNNFLII